MAFWSIQTGYNNFHYTQIEYYSILMLLKLILKKFIIIPPLFISPLLCLGAKRLLILGWGQISSTSSKWIFNFLQGHSLQLSKCCKKQNLPETFWTMTVGAKVVPNGVKAPNWKSLYTSFIVPGDPRPHSAGQDAASYNFYIKPSFSITVIKVRDLSYFMFGSCTHKYVWQ